MQIEFADPTDTDPVMKAGGIRARIDLLEAWMKECGAWDEDERKDVLDQIRKRLANKNFKLVVI